LAHHHPGNAYRDRVGSQISSSATGRQRDVLFCVDVFLTLSGGTLADYSLQRLGGPDISLTPGGQDRLAWRPLGLGLAERERRRVFRPIRRRSFQDMPGATISPLQSQPKQRLPGIC